MEKRFLFNDTCTLVKKSTPFFSVIIPVYNGGYPFRRCLTALREARFTDWELIVVDDGSDDGTDALARKFGARFFSTGKRMGPAAARNAGAKIARGRYLFFVDADCELHPDTLCKAAKILLDHPEYDAIFGSYDDAPAAPNFVAQYKNLFHHYVHQQAGEDASTFWTGCGAIKRSVFLRIGGFDAQRYSRPSIEDIDLGYRLKQAGGRIHLAKQLQVKHLKAWTFRDLLKSDILDRGIPWTRLILRNKTFTGDLNLQTHNRVSVFLLYILLVWMVLEFVYVGIAVLALVTAGLLVWLNVDLYRFFHQKRGFWFMLKSIPIHWLYYFYNGISFLGGTLCHMQATLGEAEFNRPPQPLSNAVEVEREFQYERRRM